MTERGMIFNGEMVRAILDGRKTQTRRPIKWKQTRFTEIGEREDGSKWPWSEDAEHSCDFWHPCPFGAVGDRIWVRETFQGPLFDYEQMESYLEDSSKFEKPEFCQYAADGKPAPEYYDADDNLRYGWRPSIHMPRWASRILLEITDVRVEKLNAISEKDATAEGVPPAGSLLPDYPGTFLTPKGDFATAKVAFQRLWESIYGEESWKANGWVWVIEFKRVEGGAA
ncbi:morphogenetic protein [Klebsiella aerogenes]|uniref:morphogenetic protein n=1 Tax=Klebsiella aerogenes TaxID=548 RepID=UPI0013D579CD|nr:morphogenetic protein [Klebsiella aerogenes]